MHLCSQTKRLIKRLAQWCHPSQSKKKGRRPSHTPAYDEDAVEMAHHPQHYIPITSSSIQHTMVIPEFSHLTSSKHLDDPNAPAKIKPPKSKPKRHLYSFLRHVLSPEAPRRPTPLLANRKPYAKLATTGGRKLRPYDEDGDDEDDYSVDYDLRPVASYMRPYHKVVLSDSREHLRLVHRMTGISVNGGVDAPRGQVEKPWRNGWEGLRTGR